MIVVLANGCFDVLHAGHVAHLEQARTFGDVLIVSLTLDKYVNKGAGRPVNPWHDRAAVLKALRSVGGVVSAINAVDAINRVRPHIFVKGIDYAGGDCFTEDIASACKAIGCELRYTDTPKRSAREIIRKAMA